MCCLYICHSKYWNNYISVNFFWRRFSVYHRKSSCMSEGSVGKPSGITVWACLQCWRPAMSLGPGSGSFTEPLPPPLPRKPLAGPSSPQSKSPSDLCLALRISSCHLTMHCSGHIWQCCQCLLGHALWLSLPRLQDSWEQAPRSSVSAKVLDH